jgi:uncharacterized protein YdbL (DUF1318 family)
MEHAIITGPDTKSLTSLNDYPIEAGKLSYEDIAEYSGLSLEKVRELAGNKSA